MIGRGERIRTSGPYVPNVVLYQAELLPGAAGYSDSPGPLQSRGMAHRMAHRERTQGPSLVPSPGPPAEGY